MRIYHSGYGCYIIVVMACGLLHLGDGQNNSACWEVTSSSDFKQFENSCFYVSYPKYEYWTKAQSICEIFKGNLATVARQETLMFLQQNWDTQYKTFWIGLYANVSDMLNDPSEEKRRQAEWKWLDGTPYNYRNDVGWYNNDPWYQDQFGALRDSNWISDGSINQAKHNYICEAKLPSTIQPYPTPTDPVTVRPQQPDKADPGGSQTRRPVSAPSDPGNACTKATGHPDLKMLGNSCFYVSSPTDLREWYSAQTVCVSFKGNLATVAQQETLDFLQNNWQIEHKYYWIGLYANDSQILRNGTLEQRRQAEWKWLDGTPYNYQNGLGWHQYEPWYQDYFGVLLSTNWAAEHLNQTKFRFICETKLPYNTTQTTTQSTTVTTIQQTNQPEGEKESPPTQTSPVPSTGQSPECGMKWTYNDTVKKCYSLRKSETLLNWTTAENICKELANGSHLASPSTDVKHAALVTIISNKELNGEDIWIGLTHVEGAGLLNPKEGWEWVDGSPNTFTAWVKNEPGQGEKYVRLKEGMWWAINTEGAYHHYLCQKEPTVTYPPVTYPPENYPGQTSDVPKVPGIPPTAKPPTDTNGPIIDSKVKNINDANPAGNQGTNVLGPVLGALLGVVLIALVLFLMVMKTQRREPFHSMMNRLKIGPFSKKHKKSDENINTAVSIEQTNDHTEVNSTRTIAAASAQQVIMITPENEKLYQNKQDHNVIPAKPNSEKPINVYQSNSKGTSAARSATLYATVKEIFTFTSLPKLKKPASMDATSDRTYENTTISTVIRVEELNDWVKQATASKLIENQYKSLPSANPQQSKAFCNQQQFKPKNRYRNLVPYDSNRVELSLLPNEPYSHYINASYIDSYKRKKAFIAAQGPTAQTVNDFWRMIWEKSVKTVVMVSNQIESNTGRVNFVQYWPKGKDKEAFGDVSVMIKKVENFPNYIVRHMSITKDGDIKVIKQFFFKAWRDHGVPKHAMALINFRDKIRKEMSKGKDPVLVHCSAGVGRTGTFIAIDYLLEQAAKEGVVDFVSCLRKLREQRTDMIQKLIQYQFLIRAVLEAITLGQTAIPSAQFVSTVQTFRDPLTDGETRMQKQFEILAHYYTEENSSDDSTPGNLPENITKNRDKKVLPASSKRVHLVTPVSGRNDYINAVFVDGHSRKSAYVATQAPLQDTVIDLWRAVFDYNSAVIVMLCPKHQLKKEEIYYPEGLGEQMDIAPFQVECLEEDEHRGVRRSQLSLKYCGLEKHVQHFSLTRNLSTMSLEEKMSCIFYIYENAKKWQQKQTEKEAPITVHCLQGTEWTGLYCTLSNLFDQMNEEQEVDVFHAIGQLRLARTEFVSTLKQYEMIYDILALYIDQFNMYSNFQ